MHTNTHVQEWAIGNFTLLAVIDDVNILDDLYKEYFKKYPDKESEINSQRRIMQLRSIIK